MSTPAINLLTIGRIARESGLSPDTIRYYERRELIERPERSSGGYRLYDRRILERLRLIHRARSMGLSLAEIHLIFSVKAHANCAFVRGLVGKKIEEVDARITALISFRDTLFDYRSRCERALERREDHCPFFSDYDD